MPQVQGVYSQSSLLQKHVQQCGATGAQEDKSKSLSLEAGCWLSP